MALIYDGLKLLKLISVTTDPVNVYKWLVYHDIKLIYIDTIYPKRGWKGASHIILLPSHNLQLHIPNSSCLSVAAEEFCHVSSTLVSFLKIIDTLKMPTRACRGGSDDKRGKYGSD